MPTAPKKGGDTGHSSKRLPRRHPPTPGFCSHRQQCGLCDVADAAERPDLLTARWSPGGAAVPQRGCRRTKPARRTSATEASGGRETCSPARGRSRAVPETRPGPTEAAVPRGPAVSPATRPPPPPRLSLPPESASSPVTAERGPRLAPSTPCLGAQVRGLGREGAGCKAAPHPVPSPLPLEARPKGQPFQGCQARSPSPTPSSTRGCALHPCQHKGPARGPGPPSTRALPGREEPVSTDGPDHQGRLGQHVPSQPNRQRPETLETGAALAAEPTGHAGVHSPALPHQGPHPGGTAGPSHTRVPRTSTHSEV